MADHPILIPTSLGPVGAVVSEPEGERRGAAILLQGAGRPARSGVNSFWTRLARDLAKRSVTVLRFDYSSEGESLHVGEGEHAARAAEISGGPRGRGELDLHLLGEVVPWFRDRIDGAQPVLAGSCRGARMALEFAGSDGAFPTPSFLIAPYLRKPGDQADPIDPLVVSSLQASLKHAPTWLLVGELEEPAASALLERLDPADHDLELDISPHPALHLLDQPEVQEEVNSWLASGLTRVLV